MSDYPQLTEMGIQHPEQIQTYMVNSIARVDVLRVVYQRKEGSLLPASRSYEFPRVQRTVKNAKGGDDVVLETAPPLRAAISELKALLETRKEKPIVAATLLEEIKSLEREIAWRIEHIKKTLEDA